MVPDEYAAIAVTDRPEPNGLGVKIRPVEGRDGYYVGCDGSGWKKDRTGKLTRLNVHRRRDGCALVSVTRDGLKVGAIYLARAVLTAFVGPPPAGYVARHWPDPDPANNRVENLHWGPPGVIFSRPTMFAEPTPPPEPVSESAQRRDCSPFADWIAKDRQRSRRLARTATAEQYRTIQACANHKLGGVCRGRRLSWD